MLVNLTPSFYLRLADLLEEMSKDADQHYGLADSEELIEPWKPSDKTIEEDRIECQLTVGDLRIAKELLSDLRSGREQKT